MLMDEPFGAVDPINRERLQNEFLRLQTEIRKTVLFVTHDIDEAIKMGDRIAILQEGGRLAQYATPAELLMAPANDFVEDFVGADRALKRLALMRVRDIDLWQAPLAFVGQATGRSGRSSKARRSRTPSLVDSERRPIGWLSESDLQAETVPATPDSGPEPILDLDDVMRDALADLLQSRDPVRAGDRSRQGGSRACSPSRSSPTSWARPRRRSRSTRRSSGRWSTPSANDRGAVQLAPLVGQVTIHNRTGPNAPCQAQEARCSVFGWAIDNFDRYTTPFLNQLLLVLVAVGIGFAVAFAFAILSHRQRWLIPTFTGATGVLYTIPSLAFIFLLLPITGLGWETAIIVLSVYTLQIIYRNIVAGLANVPVESKDAGRGMGMTDRQLLWRVELPLALPEIIAGLRIATVSTVAISTLMVFANVNTLGAAALPADRLQDQHRDRRRPLDPDGDRRSTFCCLLTQRLLAPWRRPSMEASV